MLKSLTAAEIGLRYIDQRLDMDMTATHFNVTLSNLLIENSPTPQITLDQLEMEDLRVAVLMGAHPAGDDRTTDGAVKEPAHTDPQTGVWIRSIRARNFGFTFADARQKLDLALTDFSLSLDDIVVGTRADAPAHATVQSDNFKSGLDRF